MKRKGGNEERWGQRNERDEERRKERGHIRIFKITFIGLVRCLRG